MVKGLDVFYKYFSEFTIETFKVTNEELNNLKITGVQELDIINTLRDTFGLLK